VGDNKADAGVIPDQNGRQAANRQFTIVADQIRAAADQLKAGRYETTDQSSVALNQALAQTLVKTDGTPSAPVTQPQPDPIPLEPDAIEPRLTADLEAAESPVAGPLSVADADGPPAIELISSIAEAAATPPLEVPRPIMAAAPVAGPIIDLPSAAAEAGGNDRPRGARKPVIGGLVGLTQTGTAPGRIGEAFPTPPASESAVNGAARTGDGGLESSLGMYLIANRERRGVKREEAAHDTRIPANYLHMMESNDYSMISDQLYLLPFLRRYAEYLELDSEEVAIRFVREVQRTENAPIAGLPYQTLNDEPGASNRWVIIGAVAIVALVAAWLVIHQHHHSAADETADTETSSAPADGASPNSTQQYLAPNNVQDRAAPSTVTESGRSDSIQGNPPNTTSRNNPPPPPPGGTE